MALAVGSNVRCIFTMRPSKVYSRYGSPAHAGDEGEIVQINELKDVTIVEFETVHGKRCAHIQNLIDNSAPTAL